MLQVLTMCVVSQALSSQINTEGETMSQTVKTIELVQGSGEVQHAIIWLHGLGASANDFPPIVPELGLNTVRAIRFIFPQAPNRPITINGGMWMPAWYDIKGANIEDKQDRIGMGQSQVLLEDLIQQQIDMGIPSSNIIIAGFSQGGAVVYHTGLRSKHKLAGMLALSTYLPFAEQLPTELSEINSGTPIFASHGIHDVMVPFQFGKNSVETLTKLGYQIEWRSYSMEHQVVMEQIQDIGVWINKVFSESDAPMPNT